MKMSMVKQVRNQLIELSEPEYRDFSSKLLPGTEHILGVRLPLLRKEAKKLVKADWKSYLKELEIFYISSSQKNNDKDDKKEIVYFEEIMLSGMIIGLLKVTQNEKHIDKQSKKQPEKQSKRQSKKIQEQITLENIFSLIGSFIPKIDNWSVCDSFCAGLKIAKEYKEEVWEFLMPYLKSDKEYFIRFGIVMLLNYYLDEEHIDAVIGLMDGIDHEAYYVKMAAAWCLSMCYVNFPDKTLEYLKSENNLDDFTYNKTIQKAMESLKVEKTEKEKLRAMKR